MKLKNKVALIMAAPRVWARRLPGDGQGRRDIVICDINAKTLPGARPDRGEARCLSVRCDVSSVDSVASLFRRHLDLHTLDILARASWLARLLSWPGASRTRPLCCSSC